MVATRLEYKYGEFALCWDLIDGYSALLGYHEGIQAELGGVLVSIAMLAHSLDVAIFVDDDVYVLRKVGHVEDALL